MLSTKGRTLDYLFDSLEHSNVLPLFLVARENFDSNTTHLLDLILNKKFIDIKNFAIRSSFLVEDTLKASNAGVFLTLLDVKRDALEDSINAVFNSNNMPNPNDEVIVQPMVENVTSSGVVMTYDRDTNNSYRIIEYTDSPNTELVTSGKSSESKLKIYWRESYRMSKDSSVIAIGKMVDELEKIFQTDKLDIEFAFIEGQVKPFVLQVRPIASIDKILTKLEPQQTEKYLSVLESKLKGIFQAHPFLVGKTTILGVMPDWNPAEIIGIRPKPLALSLYRELITDGMWAYQRHNYGYRNLRSFPLMIDLVGQPFIDVRTSFNSFIPEKLDDGIANKLVNGYLEKLGDQPSLHDKVEFEIVVSCLTLDFDHQTSELKSMGLNDSDVKLFRTSLQKITQNIFSNSSPIWINDMERVDKLNERREKTLNSNLSPLGKIYWLLEDCKRYGTLPFGGLARAAFISTQLLNSFENQNLISSDQKELILKTTQTVASEFLKLFTTGNKKEFLSKFGHLRPGTYDITQLSYKDAPNLYLNYGQKLKIREETRSANIDLLDIGIDFRKIGTHLQTIGIDLEPETVFEYITKTIELRESSKLNFSHNLSAALDILSELGKELDFTREDLSFLNCNSLKTAYLSASALDSYFLNTIKQNRDEYEICKSLWLPPLIKTANDIYVFEINENVINFIGQDCVEAGTSVLSKQKNIEGTIVLIESADPGFDWIFTEKIKGLITAYGGINSHMAVRASEFGLPCAIGVGQKKFNDLIGSSRIRLDCGNKLITILS
jgi:phosphohistidine swiveling domain-containing protein